MTRTAYARLAGFMFLFYIGTASPGVILFEQATNAAGIAAKLASIAQHAPHMHLAALFSLLTILDAVVLAVALYAITRDHDPNLALLALSCRVVEGVMLGAIPTLATLGLLSLATGAAAADAPDAAVANALGTLLLNVRGWSWIVGASVFALGSTLYSYLFLRARSIPAPLAWLGILASILLLAGLPPQLVGSIKGPVVYLMWLPMFAFEVALGLWLLVKGVAMPPTRPSPVAHAERVHARD